MSLRVYEFSKKIGISSKDILEVLKDNNFDVPSHMSILSDEAILLLETFFGKNAAIKELKKSEPDMAPQVVVPEAQAKSEPRGSAVSNQPLFTVAAMTVSDFAAKIEKPLNEVILTLIKQGLLANRNSVLSEPVVKQLATHYNLLLTDPAADKKAENSHARRSEVVGYGKKEERPPIIVVMGHVDHGKTTLLDYIRKTRVAAREKGGITQHLGAYEVKMDQGNVVFLDTPGHEAFSMMRARGSKVADMAVLVVAGDDGVMPQTVEAIKQAKAAHLPIIVAINKMDKVSATQIEHVKRGLTQYDLVPEEWGGQTVVMPISAKTGAGVKDLLDILVLQSQMMELSAHPEMPAQGFILESKLEKGRGPVATVICHNGILRVGDVFSAGKTYGKITSLINSEGKRVLVAGPSVPVSVSGFEDLPYVGDDFKVVPADQVNRKKIVPESRASFINQSSHKDAFNIILKTEGVSSQEALITAIKRLSLKVKKDINIIHAGIGSVTESDVILAADTKSFIYGLHVKVDTIALLLAQKSKISIVLFDIIYKLLEDIEARVEAGKPVKMIRKKIGEAAVLKVFDIKNLGVIAGAYVRSGKFSKDGTVTVWRGKHKVGEGSIKSLQRDKKSVKEVHTGFECAFLIDTFDAWEQDDRVECYIEIPDTL